MMRGNASFTRFTISSVEPPLFRMGSTVDLRPS